MKLLGIFLVLLVLGSGCLDGTGTAPAAGPSDRPSSSQGLPPTTAAAPAPDEETGSLVVTVTSEEMEPLSGVQILLDGHDLTAFTDAGGQATFNGLIPGKYTVLAAKPGYRTDFDKGRLVDVLAGEVVETKFVLRPESVVDASNVYHRSFNFVGLMGCSFQGAPGTVGYTTYCSRGVTVAGQSVRDPNDNSSHFWDIDSIQVQTILVEGRWQASNAVNSRALMVGTYTTFSCTDPGNAGVARTCTPGGAIAERAGPSPAYVIAHEGPDQNLTKKRLGIDPAKYPVKVRTEVRAACDGCVGFAIVLQQKYDAWGTAFYGAEAPASWSVYPSR